jgi:hypothetical protein
MRRARLPHRIRRPPQGGPPLAGRPLLVALPVLVLAVPAAVLLAAGDVLLAAWPIVAGLGWAWCVWVSHEDRHAGR